MPNSERCRERAQECQRRAEIMSNPRDRAQWLKLAEGWIAFSRIPFQSDPTADRRQTPQSGLWRGESVGHRTD
jgi:hypothetical protein